MIARRITNGSETMIDGLTSRSSFVLFCKDPSREWDTIKPTTVRPSNYYRIGRAFGFNAGHHILSL